jgi:hypothetical protein
MTTRNRSLRTHRIVVLLMAVAVLVPSLYGFGTKFLEFIAVYRGDVEGAFAISPILNYLLASLGFLFLFLWAALGGMFRDIEGPKYTMLENEALLDQGQTQKRQNDFDGPVAGRMTAADGPAAPRTHRFRDHYEPD